MTASRDTHIDHLASETFDLVVLGGGILGCWTALDAARRGLRVALLERSDWGSGTSMSSSKLIHGGLRYLEHGWFSLVGKALAERQTLLAIAPHRVRPLRFLVPLRDHTRFSPWKLRAGLWLYDTLGGDTGPIPRRASWSADAFKRAFPWVSPDVNAGFAYGDAQVDDARLTLEVALAAQQAGATALTGATGNIRTETGRLTGLQVRDHVTGREFHLTSSCVVSACGPWPGGPPPAGVRRTRGVHLVLPALPGNDTDAMLITSPRDGRVGFLIPWEGRTLLGTTDTDWSGDPASPGVDDADVDYLLEMASTHLANPYERDDIIAMYSGVRVLQANPDGSPSGTTREFDLRCPTPGVFNPVGGKLTSARVEGAQIVDAVFEHLDRDPVPCATGVPLPRTPHGDPQIWFDRQYERARQLGLDDETASALSRRYGTAADDVLVTLRNHPEFKERIHPELPYIRAEIPHAIRHEDARTLDDVLRRRMPALILARFDDDRLDSLQRLADSALGIQ